jgi:hypothetical protein
VLGLERRWRAWRRNDDDPADPGLDGWVLIQLARIGPRVATEAVRGRTRWRTPASSAPNPSRSAGLLFGFERGSAQGCRRAARERAARSRFVY